MLQTLRLLLFGLGASAIGIALSILVLGAEPTAAMAERLYGAVAGWRGPSSGHWPPTMDSELRFYSALWGAYGVLVLRTALSLPRRLAQVPWLAAIFFAGGVGRGLSRISVGAPHPFFTVLMAIELALPGLLALLWLGVRARLGERRLG